MKRRKTSPLDIARFFMWTGKDKARGIWDESGLERWPCFQNIQNKCVVEVNSINIIRIDNEIGHATAVQTQVSGTYNKLKPD